MPTGTIVLIVIGVALLALMAWEIAGHRRRKRITQSHADHRERHDPPPGDGFHANNSSWLSGT